MRLLDQGFLARVGHGPHKPASHTSQPRRGKSQIDRWLPREKPSANAAFKDTAKASSRPQRRVFCHDAASQHQPGIHETKAHTG